jgi:putative heme-binding domain-containing protein
MLLDQLTSISDDPLMQHATKVALRNQLQDTTVMNAALHSDWQANHAAQLAHIALAVPTPQSAEMILRELERATIPAAELPAFLNHVSRYISSDHVERLAKLARHHASADLALQAELFRSIQQSLPPDRLSHAPSLRDWGSDLVQQIVEQCRTSQGTVQLLSGDPGWAWEPRQASDGNSERFFSSLPGGETQTSRLVSQPFTAPASLAFELCGHRGDPSRVATPVGDRTDSGYGAPSFLEPPNDCYVQLRLTQTGQVIRRAYPPRQDHGVRVNWNLEDVAGHEAQLELIDQLADSSYAWLGIARIEPAAVTLPGHTVKQLEAWQTMAAELIGSLKLVVLEDQLRAWITDGISWNARVSAAEERMRLTNRADLHPLGQVLSDVNVTLAVRSQLATLLAQPTLPEPDVVFQEYIALFQQLAGPSQRLLARRMTLSREGSELLVQLVERGVADGAMLQAGPIRAQLEASAGPQLAAKAEELTAGLPPSDNAVSQIAQDAWQQFDPAAADPDAGKATFEKNCRICHQIGGQGALVGPQLDGIGKRGLARLVEDVLIPHRNVDQAFRTSIVTLTDGRVLSGLLRESTGPEVTIVDTQGKETNVQRTAIESHDRSPLSVMPDNFAEVLSAEQRRDLFAYLLGI